MGSGTRYLLDDRQVCAVSRRLAALGVVLGPVLWTGYLLAVGVDRLPEPLGPFPSSPALWGIFLGTAAGVGLLVGWFAPRLQVTAVLVPLLVAVLPWTRPTPVATLFVLNNHLLFVLVAGLLLGTIEYGIHHPGLVERVLTRRAIVVGTIAGGLHLGLAVWLRTAVFEFSWGRGSLLAILLVGWICIGALLTGGVPGLLLARFGLLAPMTLVAAAFSWSAYETWVYVQELEASGAARAASITPFTLYLVVWFAVLTAALLAGGLEFRVRRGELPALS